MSLRIIAIGAAASLGQAICAGDPPPPAAGTLRVATYNIALYGREAGQVAERLAAGNDRQASSIAEVIQRVRPDVLLLCEIDYDPETDPPRLFVERYLSKPQAEGLEPIDYPHRFTAPVNTGVPSGLDLDRDGRTDGPGDAWGFGRYPGQYGMALLSRFPIDADATRTFQNLRREALPVSRAPVDPSTGGLYYPHDVWDQLRLASKSFWDVVVRTPGIGTLHLLCSHPTPPVFDGPEDRNGCRNADEIRLLNSYVDSRSQLEGDWLIDDQGLAGPIRAKEAFVILGDLNADPFDGSGHRDAIRDLLAHPRLADHPAPLSLGAFVAATTNGELNSPHKGPAEQDTADFSGDGHANLRVDYALPSSDLEVVATGVYWPRPGEPGAEAVKASDHRLVWVDVRRAGDADE